MYGFRFFRLAVCIIVLLLHAQPASAHKRAIRKGIKEIVAEKNLKLGVGIYDFQTEKTFFFRGNAREKRSENAGAPPGTSAFFFFRGAFPRFG